MPLLALCGLRDNNNTAQGGCKGGYERDVFTEGGCFGWGEPVDAMARQRNMDRPERNTASSIPSIKSILSIFQH